MTCRSEHYSGGTANRVPWSNWAELAGGLVDTHYEPASLADIVGIVQDADARQKHIRVVGSGWAFDDIAYSSDIMVSLVRLQHVLEYVTDPDAGALLSLTLPNGRRLVHVEAGMKVATLNAQLDARGLAMPTLGGSNGQSIVGAFSTSTHGADFYEPPFCDFVHAMHVVGPGGQEYWIERESGPITSSARLGQVLPCPDTLIIRDDEAFDAMVVGFGRFGIVYSVVLETVRAYSLGQQRDVLPTPVVLALLRGGQAAGTGFHPLLDALPAPSAQLSVVGGVRGMQLLIDPRSPQLVHAVRRWDVAGLDPPQPTPGPNAFCQLGAGGLIAAGVIAIFALGMFAGALKDPAVLADPTRPLRLTAKAAELGIRLAANPNMRPGEALALVTNAFWDLGISQLPDAISLVGYITQYGTARGPSYSIMTGAPTYDPSGQALPHELHNCYKANSCEVMFDAADSRYIDFLAIITNAAPQFRQAGYISARFSKRSRALLSMLNVASEQAVSIEVSAFKGMLDSAAWIDFVLQAALPLGGRPHWGQQNRLIEPQVKSLYGDKLDRWRAVLSAYSGNSTLFSSTYTIAKGLEPEGKRDIKVEGPAGQVALSVDAAILALLLDDERPRREDVRPPHSGA
jgi:FAD binding domain/D-arabinono-1,4-lactone oxidase